MATERFVLDEDQIEPNRENGRPLQTVLAKLNLMFAALFSGERVAGAVTATADGLTTGIVPEEGGFFTVTSGNADHIVVLPEPEPGKLVILHVGANGFELRSSAPETVAINAGTGVAAESAIAANSTCFMICVSATAWKGWFLDADSDLAKVQAAAP